MKNLLLTIGLLASVALTSMAGVEPATYGSAYYTYGPNGVYQPGNFLTNQASVDPIATNWTYSVLVASNSTETAFTGANTVLEVYKGQKGVGIWASFASTAGTSTSNVVFRFVVSNDRTNWSTIPITATFAENGTNEVVGFVPLTESSIGFAKFIKARGVLRSDSITTNKARINYLRYGTFTP